MRTSLNNIKQIDDHLHGQLPVPDALLFEARLLIDDQLAGDVYWHKQTLHAVNQYGRSNLRNMINNVHRQLFTQPAHQSFRQKILDLFR